jgi:sugar lactone lactonase YvrE
MVRVLQAELAVPAQCELAEGPVWDSGSGAGLAWASGRGVLRWVDILAGRVHSFEPSTGAHDWFEVGECVGSVGLTSSGSSLVLALTDRFALYSLDAAAGGPGRSGTATDVTARLTRLAPSFSVDRLAVRFNDGKPDPWGNFWAGTMPLIDGDPGGALYKLTPDGTVSTLIPQVGLSNGLDWTDDRRTFYYADSTAQIVDAFACDPDTGTLAVTANGTPDARRRFLTIPEAEGLPDGLTLDGDGCMWLAVWGSGEMRRYTPDGRLDTIVRVPATQVSCPAFAPDGTLYITTAREGFTPAQREAQPHAGDIFACTPGAPTRPANRFNI